MKKGTTLAVAACVVVGAGALAIYVTIQSIYAQRIRARKAVTPHAAALVLGSSVKSRRPNTILQERLNTAEQLYREKKAQKLILSGDNRTVEYNEPQAMKDYLVARGIPESDLVLDHAGRRTYDSCYRARDIFNLSSIIIVSQTFHLPRALYVCNALGLDAVGVASDEEHPERWWFSYIREVPATLGAWIDITFRRPTPILGNPEKVF